MSIDERQRHELYEGLVEALGPERADTLMELVPPVGWADVATKQDLDAHSVLMKQDLDAHNVLMKQDLDAHSVLMKQGLAHFETVMGLRLDKAVADLRTEMHIGLRNLLLGIFGSVMAAAVLNQVLAKLL